MIIFCIDNYQITLFECFEYFHIKEAAVEKVTNKEIKQIYSVIDDKKFVKLVKIDINYKLELLEDMVLLYLQEEEEKNENYFS